MVPFRVSCAPPGGTSRAPFRSHWTHPLDTVDAGSTWAVMTSSRRWTLRLVPSGTKTTPPTPEEFFCFSPGVGTSFLATLNGHQSQSHSGRSPKNTHTHTHPFSYELSELEPLTVEKPQTRKCIFDREVPTSFRLCFEGTIFGVISTPKRVPEPQYFAAVLPYVSFGSISKQSMVHLGRNKMATPLRFVTGRPLICFVGFIHCKPLLRRTKRYPQKP